MALFTGSVEQGYARGAMPQPALADGPWGEAIRYWLNERKWRQADLAKRTHIRANTISRATRGFHTTTRVLERIALALNAPLDAVLVSPERKLANEDRRRLARDIAEDVLLKFEARSAGGHDERSELAALVMRMPLEAVANYKAMLGDILHYKGATAPTKTPATPKPNATSKKSARGNVSK